MCFNGHNVNMSIRHYSRGQSLAGGPCGKRTLNRILNNSVR